MELIFGTGMCFSMQVLGSGILAMIFGIILGIAGALVMAAAYPVYRKKQQKMKERLAPKILELSNELLKGEIKDGI